METTFEFKYRTAHNGDDKTLLIKATGEIFTQRTDGRNIIIKADWSVLTSKMTVRTNVRSGSSGAFAYSGIPNQGASNFKREITGTVPEEVVNYFRLAKTAWKIVCEPVDLDTVVEQSARLANVLEKMGRIDKTVVTDYQVEAKYLLLEKVAKRYVRNAPRTLQLEIDATYVRTVMVHQPEMIQDITSFQWETADCEETDAMVNRIKSVLYS